MTDVAFGRGIADAQTPDEALALETATGRGGDFGPLDRLAGGLLRRAFSGDLVVNVSASEVRGVPPTVELLGLSAEERRLVDQRFDLTAQQTAGAWFLPEEAAVRTQLLTLPHHLRVQPAFAHAAAGTGPGKLSLAGAPDAFAVSALLAPLFADVLAPFELRAGNAAVKAPDVQRAAWSTVDETYRHLGLDVNEQLAVLRYGGGWGRLRTAEQQAARTALLEALADQVGEGTAERHRALLVTRLAAGFYKKAKKGSPLARSVLTAPLKSVLAAHFGGSWLAFLAYLDEQPAPGEELPSALPEPRLYVGGQQRAATVAAEQGIPVDEVEKMLAAYLGTATVNSPVDERVSVMRSWWEEFDAIHARQRTGMPSLWGLVDEGYLYPLDTASTNPTTHLYRQLVSEPVVADIDRLWDGACLARWPESIVSEFHPHHAMADAFGAALKFWHGVSLTAWFVCEGPYSRTSIDGLRKYYAAELAELERQGAPVDPGLFDDLKRAESKLGPPEPIERRQEHVGTAGLTIEISMSVGSRRAGFEILRDVIAAHRRTWAGLHLDPWLHQRWQTDLRAVAREHNKAIAAKGKPPTLKQFAKFAATTANRWFGGDLGALYAAVGEKAPAHQERVDLLAGEPSDFVERVFVRLGGRHDLPEDASWKDRDTFNANWATSRLAGESLRYLQLWEALGREPTLKEFGEHRIADGPDVEVRWREYVAIVDEERRRPAATPANHRRSDATAPAAQPPPPPAKVDAEDRSREEAPKQGFLKRLFRQ